MHTECCGTEQGVRTLTLVHTRDNNVALYLGEGERVEFAAWKEKTIQKFLKLIIFSQCQGNLQFLEREFST